MAVHVHIGYRIILTVQVHKGSTEFQQKIIRFIKGAQRNRPKVTGLNK